MSQDQTTEEPPSSEHARHIYQTWLDRVSEAIWHGHFDVVADAMHYPHAMATLDAALTHHVQETLIAAARDFRDMLQSIGAQAYHRICNRAHFAGPDRIEGHHTTYVLRGAMFALPPFANELELAARDGEWKGVSVRSAVVNAMCPVLSPELLLQTRETARKED